MEVEAAMVLVRGGSSPGGVGVVVRPDGSGDQRVPPSAGAAINFAADADGSLDSAYEDNFDCGEEAMQRRLLISRILSSPLLFCASPAPSSQDSQMKAPPSNSEFIDQKKSPLMTVGSSADSGTNVSPQPLGLIEQPHGPPAPSEASDEDTEDANLELSRADTEVYECSLSDDASSPGKTTSRDSSVRRDSENVSDAAMVDSPYAPDTTSEEEEDIGDASDLARSLRSEVARLLYEMISRVSMEYESLDEDSNDCESCPEVPCESWRSRRPLSGRSVSTDSGVSSVHDDSRISLSSQLSHCSSSQSSSQSSRSSECASSPATTMAPDSSDEAAITERAQRRRSSRLLDLSSTLASAIAGSTTGSLSVARLSTAATTTAGTATMPTSTTISSTRTGTIRTETVPMPSENALLFDADASTTLMTKPATTLATPVAVNVATTVLTSTAITAEAISIVATASPTVTGTAACDRIVDHQPPLKVHVTAKSCATSTTTTANSAIATSTAVRRDGGYSITRSHSKNIINQNNNIFNNNNNNNNITAMNDNNSKHNINMNHTTANNNKMKKNGLDIIEKALLPGPAQPTALTVTAKGTSRPSPLQARLGPTSLVKPSAEPQLAFPPVFVAPHPKPLLSCRWKECGFSARKDFELADHIADAHVAAQGDKGPFVCLWEACKVFNVPSTLKHWLEQHVVKHSRSKPLKCIVDGCPQRFSTKALLEAHVNSHFEKNPKLKNEASLKSQNQLLKLAKRKRLLRQHSKMQAGRKYDFFDACIMHQIKESLLQLAEVEQTSFSTLTHHSNHSPAHSAGSTFAATASSDLSSIASSSSSVAGATLARNHPGRKRPTTACSNINTPLSSSSSATGSANTHCPRRSSRRKIALTSELTVQTQTQSREASTNTINRNHSEPVVVLGPRCVTNNLPGQSSHRSLQAFSPDSGFDTSDPAPASPPQFDDSVGTAGFSAALASAAAAGRLLMPPQHSPVTSTSFSSLPPPMSLSMSSKPTNPSESMSNLQRMAAAAATPTAYKLDPATAALAPFLGSMTSKRSFARRLRAEETGGGGRGGTACTRSMTSSSSSSSLCWSLSSLSSPSLTPLSPSLSTSLLAADDGPAAALSTQQTPLVESLARAVRMTRSGQRQMLISFYRPRRATAEEAGSER